MEQERRGRKRGGKGDEGSDGRGKLEGREGVLGIIMQVNTLTFAKHFPQSFQCGGRRKGLVVLAYAVPLVNPT